MKVTILDRPKEPVELGTLQLGDWYGNLANDGVALVVGEKKGGDVLVIIFPPDGPPYLSQARGSHKVTPLYNPKLTLETH